VISLLEGDCRQTLDALAAGSIQACVTSPPYYGLRDYDTEPLVWGGDAECAHEWQAAHSADWYGSGSNASSSLDASAQTSQAKRRNRGSMGTRCACGAWCGSLGLEPTPELYIEHLVECFSHVRRVLRADGLLWLNLGDSYAGSGKGPSRSLNQGNPHAHAAAEAMREHGLLAGRGVSGRRSGAGPATAGYKPKDLMLMPFRVALALQADGWYLRSVIPWLKRAAMPESVRDRPASAVEYVFLLSRSRRYSWHGDAVRVGVTGNAHDRGNGINPKSRANGAVPPGEAEPNADWVHKVPSGWDTAEGSHRRLNGRYRSKQNASFSGALAGVQTGPRNRRNADWFFESWQGLLLDECDEPLALVVNPAPYAGAHYATFPPKLVEPMLKASTRAGDTVLDPFAGAGTVGLVADRLGRNAVLCELKAEYAGQSVNRLRDDAPLFVEIAGGPDPLERELLVDKQAASGVETYVGFNARWKTREAAE